MPYKTNKELPEKITKILPSHAQDIYREAFNHAFQEYRHKEDRKDDATREETSHKVAWAAVKKKYQKDESKWVEK